MRPREEWVELKGATPTLVSEDLFNQVQLKLKRNKELASRNARREYLLSGYVFCENCGRRYTAHSKGNNSYYSCPKCRDGNLNANYLETSIWIKVEEVLSNPEVVLGGIEMMRNEADNEELYREELDGVELKLRHMAREKDRVWKAFEITGDEAKFTREIKDIMLEIDEFEKRKVELGNRIESSGQTEVNIQSIKEYCELARHNLVNLSFSEKRKALESLGVRVVAGKGDLRLEGIIPIMSTQCA
jgi:site-specific DNA recombinase